MGNVVSINNILTVQDVLDRSSDVIDKDVVVIGRDKGDEILVLSSIKSSPELLWLLKMTEGWLTQV